MPKMINAGMRKSSARKSFELVSDRVALKFESCRSQREVEKRLLPVAQHIEAALYFGRPLLKHNFDMGNYVVKSLADETEAGIGIRVVIVKLLPTGTQRGADRVDRCFCAECIRHLLSCVFDSIACF